MTKTLALTPYVPDLASVRQHLANLPKKTPAMAASWCDQAQYRLKTLSTLSGVRLVIGAQQAVYVLLTMDPASIETVGDAVTAVQIVRDAMKKTTGPGSCLPEMAKSVQNFFDTALAAVQQPQQQQVMPQQQMTAQKQQQLQHKPPQQQAAPPPPPPAPPAGGGLDADALAQAPPHRQKQMLGERLFPLIQQKQPALAGKITGMLLEMENSDLLSLLDSQQELDGKIAEAIKVLQEDAEQRPFVAGLTSILTEIVESGECPGPLQLQLVERTRAFLLGCSVDTGRARQIGLPGDAQTHSFEETIVTFSRGESKVPAAALPSNADEIKHLLHNALVTALESDFELQTRAKDAQLTASHMDGAMLEKLLALPPAKLTTAMISPMTTVWVSTEGLDLSAPFRASWQPAIVYGAAVANSVGLLEPQHLTADVWEAAKQSGRVCDDTPWHGMAGQLDQQPSAEGSSPNYFLYLPAERRLIIANLRCMAKAHTVSRMQHEAWVAESQRRDEEERQKEEQARASREEDQAELQGISDSIMKVVEAELGEATVDDSAR
eukprot:COSAG04_NODE_5340_length_1650_cov_1.636364_1_plen_549_part_11